jgi:transposase
MPLHSYHQVMDNAPIHVADDMLGVLETILDLADVRLFFLPKYSPELNPCEMVFAQVRSFPRTSFRTTRVTSLRSVCAGQALSARPPRL